MHLDIKNVRLIYEKRFNAICAAGCRGPRKTADGIERDIGVAELCPKIPCLFGIFSGSRVCSMHRVTRSARGRPSTDTRNRPGSGARVAGCPAALAQDRAPALAAALSPRPPSFRGTPNFPGPPERTETRDHRVGTLWTPGFMPSGPGR